jgi:8-oxo-dGTP pyrophosphatase MutT (NUDIX family)
LNFNRVYNFLKDYRPETITAHSFHDSAVNIVFTQQQQPSIIFLRRSTQVTHHKGQFSFPGGKKDAADADLLATALRETEEETGIPVSHFRPLGQLDNFLTVTNYNIATYVSLYEGPLPIRYKIDNRETDFILEVDAKALVDDNNITFLPFHYHNRVIHIPHYWINGFHLWGVTAILLLRFSVQLGYLAHYESYLSQLTIH